MSGRVALGGLLLLMLVLGSVPEVTSHDLAKKSSRAPTRDGEKLFRSLLLSVGSTGHNAQCYAIYFPPAPYMEKSHSAVISAGHCDNAILFRFPDGRWGIIDILIGHRVPKSDLLIGEAEDQRLSRDYFTIDNARPLPGKGEVVITAAEPASFDKIPALQRLQFLYQASSGRLVFRSEKPIIKGFSGAPAVTTKGRLIGVIVGVSADDPTIGIVTPISQVVDVFNRYVK